MLLTMMRQIEMLRILPRGPRKMDTGSLKQKLEELGFTVTQRTIQRDLKSLSAKFPILSDEPHKPAGWSWDERSVFDLPSMDAASALGFSLVAKFLEPLLPRGIYHDLEPYFSHAENLLTELKLGKWTEKVRVLRRGLELRTPSIDEEVARVVYDALLQDRQMNVCYRPRAGEPAEYRVNPLGLVFRHPVVYLVCTLFKYDDIKHLALHRMNDPVLLDSRRRMPGSFDLDEYLESKAFSYPVGGRKIKLKVLFDREVARHLQENETPLDEDQLLTDHPDGRVLVEASVLETAELRWWLMGFGDSVEVLQPKRLRNEFSKVAANLASLYGVS